MLKPNSMKKIKLSFLMAVTLVVVLNFASCSKYEDGPSFSLRSKKARLTGEWEIVKVGTQTIGDTYEIVWDFSKDGSWSQSSTYTYSGGQTYSYTYNGDWEWAADKEDLKVTYTDGSNTSTQQFKITRLTNKELWLEDSSSVKWELEAK